MVPDMLDKSQSGKYSLARRKQRSFVIICDRIVAQHRDNFVKQFRQAWVATSKAYLDRFATTRNYNSKSTP